MHQTTSEWCRLTTPPVALYCIFFSLRKYRGVNGTLAKNVNSSERKQTQRKEMALMNCFPTTRASRSPSPEGGVLRVLGDCEVRISSVRGLFWRTPVICLRAVLSNRRSDVLRLRLSRVSGKLSAHQRAQLHICQKKRRREICIVSPKYILFDDFIDTRFMDTSFVGTVTFCGNLFWGYMLLAKFRSQHISFWLSRLNWITCSTAFAGSILEL